jgi:hypothetical protein
MKRFVCAALAGAALLLGGGCSKSDELRAKQKAREAGQELKRDLKEAGQEVKQGVEKAKREIHEATRDSDRRRP